MKWTKSPEWLTQTFEHCLPMAPGVERRSMFGYPCAFVHGHMFCGLHQDDLIVRMSDVRREALTAGGARVFEPMPGRPMKEFVVAPVEVVADRETLRAWLSEALEHAMSLGLKETKKPKKASAAAKPVPSKPVAREWTTQTATKKPAKKAAAKKAAVKKTSAKKSAGKRPVAKKGTAKKTPAKKGAIKKTAAKKGAAKKKSAPKRAKGKRGSGR